MKESSKITDAELVLEYQSGNKKAITILVKRWHHQFCKQAYWYTKDKDVAKDIAQDSWNVIIHKLDTLKNPEKFGFWVLAIVSRKSIDYTRKQSRTFAKLKEYHQNLDVNFDEISENNDSRKVLKAIHLLTDNQQIVLRLFYIENYSLNEIGKTLNLATGTVKSRLFHAREKLKIIIKPRNYE